MRFRTPQPAHKVIYAGKVTAFKLGRRTSFRSRFDLNIAAFYNKFSGLQVQRQVPAPMVR
jgi:hypothetical protein